MAALELKVPAVGESITEVTIGEWLVPEGGSVKKDDPVVVIETDKVTVELPAPADGTVTKVKLAKGVVAKVGDVVGLFEAGPMVKSAKSDAESATSAKDAPARTEAVRVMPAAARVLAQAGMSAGEVQPTGPGGRVLKEDVQRTVEERARAPKAPAAVPAPRTGGAREEELVPMTPLRKRIAQRLVEAQNTAALLTTFNEIDMSAAMALRKEHQDAFVAKHGVKLGFMSFFVKAAVDALKLVPQVNAEVRGDAVVFKNYCDIGVAVGGGKGLVVPILRNAETMGFAEIEQAIAELAARAQAGKLTLEELQGGTFTISNGGIYGSLLSTPIVNPPQSGILGLHAIQERPIALGGQVVIRPMMYVALTYDHRLVDGREAVTFLKRIKECLENPARMLIEV
ncbi:MAG: 2-oxoglutarate dehydrogenase complex dihydrolipoyllysine-residue succinyltransferase [Planctomycetes bacterium]|nr:2-oxoglutarate dehydrogenase complex dihydrolipoyllysine-residue succinyltransferase [Planctomycetota bacterium]